MKLEENQAATAVFGTVLVKRRKRNESANDRRVLHRCVYVRKHAFVNDEQQQQESSQL